jgi:MFS family permease
VSSVELSTPAPAPEASHQRSLEQLETADSSQGDEVEYPTGSNFRATIVALACTLILVGLDMGIVSTAILSITNHFKTVADIGWYISAFRLTTCSFQFLFGTLYALYSVQLVFMAALAIFEAGSLLCTVAPTSAALVIGRAITGLGGAGIISGCFTIIAQTVPLHQRSLYGAVFAAAETLASVAALMLGGLLTDRLSWRACFGINLPLGAITFIIVWICFPHPRANEDRSLPIKESCSE